MPFGLSGRALKFVETAFEKFSKQKPVIVMARAMIANTLSCARLDRIFDQHADQQYIGDLLFSTVADLMGEVVLRIQPSVNAAWLDKKDEIGVTVKSVYDKLKGIEMDVSRALVQETAGRMRGIMEQLGNPAAPLVAGYRTKIVDGNHLRRTDRRIGELRKLNCAPLPGKSLVVLDDLLWQQKYGKLTPSQIAAVLKRFAGNVQLSKFKKNKWKKKPRPPAKDKRKHESTFKVLEKAGDS